MKEQFSSNFKKDEENENLKSFLTTTLLKITKISGNNPNNFEGNQCQTTM